MTDISFLGSTPTERILTMMARLRDPDIGCPWDKVQTYDSIAPYTIEEAYEVADAIARKDMAHLREELGDLLLQVVFHSQMASETGDFDFGAVADGLVTKMVRRHPHVFGDAEERDAAAQTLSWEAQKAAERARKSESGVLSGVALNLPALTRAEKLQKRAARVGFDWPDADPVLDKISEEAQEIVQEQKAGANPERMAEEVGDLLFTVVNLARHLGVDAETALRGANEKFTRRFEAIEVALKKEGRDMAAQTLDELEKRWQAVKARE